jgi:hypothetical protein
VAIDDIQHFFRIATDAAFFSASKVAWVVAHEWRSGARVRWQAGNAVSLTNYVVSPDAWRTPFLGSIVGEVWLSDEWPHWYEVNIETSSTLSPVPRR